MSRLVIHMWKASCGVAPLNQIKFAVGWGGARWRRDSHVFEEEKVELVPPSVCQENTSGPLDGDGKGMLVRKEWRSTSSSDLGCGSSQLLVLQASATEASRGVLSLRVPSLPKTLMRGLRGVQLTNQKLVSFPHFISLDRNLDRKSLSLSMHRQFHEWFWDSSCDQKWWGEWKKVRSSIAVLL